MKRYAELAYVSHDSDVMGFLLGDNILYANSKSGSYQKLNYVTMSEMKELCKNGEVESFVYNSDLGSIGLQYTKEEIKNLKKYKIKTDEVGKFKPLESFINDEVQVSYANLLYTKYGNASGTIISLFSFPLLKNDAFAYVLIYGKPNSIRSLQRYYTTVVSKDSVYSSMLYFNEDNILGLIPLNMLAKLVNNTKLIMEVEYLHTNILSRLRFSIAKFLFKDANKDNFKSQLSLISDCSLNYLLEALK